MKNHIVESGNYSSHGDDTTNQRQRITANQYKNQCVLVILGSIIFNYKPIRYQQQ